MGTLQDHDTMVPESNDSKVVTNATSSNIGGASKYHSDPQSSRGGNSAGAGMGSDRLPQGKLDSPKVP